MKKKLEAELISIAHRILKLKNKSDVVALHQETQRLYEKLSVLRFVEEKFGDVKPTIGLSEIESKLEEFFDEEPAQANDIAPAVEVESPKPAEITSSQQPDEEEPEVTIEPETPEVEEISPEEKEETEVPQTGDQQNASEGSGIPDDVPPTTVPPDSPPEIEVAHAYEEVEESESDANDDDQPEEVTSEQLSLPQEAAKDEPFVPSFELAFDPKTDDSVETAKNITPQFSFDDLLGKDYADPVFVTPEENQPKPNIFTAPTTNAYVPPTQPDHKAVSLNDRLAKGITIGLNDRIAFMKHLFGNSSEDYNRVLSQLLTFNTYEEAQEFIDQMVKPDYDNWEGKDEYAQRFMEIVEKRFT
ncbi:MAG TPA: hypothetical protein VF581_13700 [Flavobacterium sp.]|jgi:hypothetical protein